MGTPPFPSILYINEDQFYAMLHVSGSNVTAGEIVAHPDPLYNPSGIAIRNDSIATDAFGRGNLTLTITNMTGENVTSAVVLISVPGIFNSNQTSGGVTWMYSFGDSPGGRVAAPFDIPPGGSHTTSLAVINTIPRGTTYRYSAEIRGNLGDSYFVESRSFSYTFPALAVDSDWVSSFIGLVNKARNGTPLAEAGNLDQFAALRFSTASSQPDISDYGFTSDYSRFFGSNGTNPAIAEALLYPGAALPFSYATTLQQVGRAHWSLLLDANYTHFGYYIGTAPYEVVNLPCPVAEIPGPGLNITQYFQAHGCTTIVEQTIWLVVVLGP